ncbi:MAG: carboxymuconolactone decarboxylase family protein [Chromatiales bacterium]|nr:carboxymuconolactone decarboxylase family protein [Chromatiales bacterium]
MTLVAALAPEEWDEEQRKLLAYAHEKGGFYNVLGTLARHMEASRRLGQVGAHVLGPTSTLSPRERELLVLRTAWNCESEYEWGQHVLLGRRAGISDEEIARVRQGPDAPGWVMHEAALLRAADELNQCQRISDGTWAVLAGHYKTLQLMDIVFAVGQYTLIAMALNSFATPLDEGLQGF